MKLELKHIKHYLDHDILYSIDGETGILKPYHLGMHLKTIERGQNFKLHLRPMSDLVKKIEVDGKKFVPIIELAKIKWESKNWRLSSSGLYVVENGIMTFEYTNNTFFINDIACTYQLNLFEKLFEWHFDVFGLIDQGLALPLI